MKEGYYWYQFRKMSGLSSWYIGWVGPHPDEDRQVLWESSFNYEDFRELQGIEFGPYLGTSPALTPFTP